MRPLDRVNGEVLDGLDASMHVVVEPRCLAEMTNLTTAYQQKRRFGSITKHRPVFDDAVVYAIEAFAAAGALRPIRFNEGSVLVQVYPKERKIAVVFQRAIAAEAEVRFVTRIYHGIPQVVIDSLLTNSGKQVPKEH